MTSFFHCESLDGVLLRVDLGKPQSFEHGPSSDDWKTPSTNERADRHQQTPPHSG